MTPEKVWVVLTKDLTYSGRGDDDNDVNIRLYWNEEDAREDFIGCSQAICDQADWVCVCTDEQRRMLADDEAVFDAQYTRINEIGWAKYEDWVVS